MSIIMSKPVFLNRRIGRWRLWPWLRGLRLCRPCFRWPWRRADAVRIVLLFSGGGVGLLLLLALLWWFCPWLVGDPMECLAWQTPVRRYTDVQGRLLHLERTYDHQWRLPVPLSQVSEPVIQATLAAEDAGFLAHSGVDLGAALRAFWQNLWHGRVVSGASTITMQLVGMSTPGRRSWRRKFWQVVQARSLERRYSKERILTEYLNRVPFGGKLYGIESAAWYYFGKSAAELTLAEASLLCGLPQKPNAYRPDRHWARARRRQRLVLGMMERHGTIAVGEAERVFREEPLPLRDFRLPSRLAQLADCRDGMYFQQAKAEAREAFEIVCHLDPQRDDLLFRALREQAGHLSGVRDGAGVLLDSSSGAVLALVGTLDFASPQAGQVNAALAVRSAGSALKPFIYAEAIDGGLLVEDSVLLDAPVRYGDYAPGNYDGRFHGKVNAGEALSLSLNTPAVRLLATLGPARMAARFSSLQLWPEAATAEPLAYQLDMALGTAGHTLLGLTAAYAVLARGGDVVPAQFVVAGQAARTTIFTPGCCAMVSRMLRRRPLPASAVVVSWKTGTSNGNRDAWCFAYTPEYTLGIWFGNKDGAAASVLTGAGAAAPAAAAVMTALYHNRPPPAWPSDENFLQQGALCAESGLAASPRCRSTRSGAVLRHVPLRLCRDCQADRKAAVAILSPAPGHYVAETAGQAVTLTLRARPDNVLWYVNHRYLGPLTDARRLTFVPGRHVLHAVDAESQNQSSSVEFSVGPQEVRALDE